MKKKDRDVYVMTVIAIIIIAVIAQMQGCTDFGCDMSEQQAQQQQPQQQPEPVGETCEEICENAGYARSANMPTVGCELNDVQVGNCCCWHQI